MTLTLVLLIVAAVALAWLELKKQAAKEDRARREAEYEAARDRYLAWVRGKYAGAEPHGYRRANHIDFTGETPLSPVRLAEIKQEIAK